MSTRDQSFGHTIRDQQLAWAQAGNVAAGALENRHGKSSWVLQRAHQKSNLFRAEWWTHIAGKEHRWARALNSSQCFAVNLFAMLADDRDRARKALCILLPSRDIGKEDIVAVDFEFTPHGAQNWLGEKGQATQIDVYFEVRRSDRSIGHVLVEVKFTESSFGGCRGWKARSDGRWLNPNRDRCRHVSAVLTDPRDKCWLAEPQGEGRQYWEIISRPGSSIREDAIRAAGECPFRYGLYQMMRNRVLADELVRRSGADWADFVVCHHPGNKRVFDLKEAVSSHTDAVTAFRSLSSDEAVKVWDAVQVLEMIQSTDSNLLAKWGDWMRKRYFAV